MFLKDPSPNADDLLLAVVNYFPIEYYIHHPFMFDFIPLLLKSASGKHHPDFQTLSLDLQIMSQHVHMTEEFTLPTTSTCRSQFKRFYMSNCKY